MPLTTTRYLVVLLTLLTAAGYAWADPGKDLFDKHCSGCHSIGGGDGGGPDLKGVGAKRTADWLIRIIVAPDKLAADKDQAQLELVKKFGMEMPNLGISQDDAGKITAFLRDGTAPAGAEEKQPAGAASSAQASAAGGSTAATDPPKEVVATPELVAAGRDLFSGKVRFAKGGPPCISCHSLSYPGITGGTLAADLTTLYCKMGENGVRGVLKTLLFPIMKKVYADRPLTEEEMSALTALFKDAAAKKAPAPAPYPAAGLGFFAVCLAGIIVFKRRIQ